MTALFPRLAKAATLCALALAMTAPMSEAKPATRRAPQPANLYDRAKAELPEDLYLLYRIVERIARANDLDQRPWRVGVVDSYDINAFATQVNLIALHNGLLDQLSGDSSAIACVVAHEMAHHEKRHIALGQAQEEQLTQQALQEAKAEVEREVNNARAESTATGVLGGVLGGLGGLPGLGGQILRNQSQNRRNSVDQRVQEIAKRKKAELQANIAASVRRQEFEADQVGYLLMAKAGFEPNGCLRAMEVLARTPGAEFDTSHPAVPKRIEALQELMKKQPAAKLAAEGKAELSRTQPLTYDRSRDGKTLRINSQFGGSSDIDRVLGR